MRELCGVSHVELPKCSIFLAKEIQSNLYNFVISYFVDVYVSEYEYALYRSYKILQGTKLRVAILLCNLRWASTTSLVFQCFTRKQYIFYRFIRVKKNIIIKCAKSVGLLWLLQYCCQG